MSLPDTYTRRHAPLPDVYEYDTIPQACRGQIFYILKDVVKLFSGVFSTRTGGVTTFEQHACDYLRRETGEELLHRRAPGRTITPWEELEGFTRHHPTITRIFDFIELCFRSASHNLELDTALNGYSKVRQLQGDLNERLREAGVGYQLESGSIIRMDNAITHQEVVRPALALLSDPRFTTAHQEYLTAHEHYRMGRYPDCIVSCGKAFESTIKIIAHLKGWALSPTATANDLVKACFEQNLFASFHQPSLRGFRALLENAVPAARNKTSAHGGGVAPTPVSQGFTEYVLHQSALMIRYIITTATGATP